MERRGERFICYHMTNLTKRQRHESVLRFESVSVPEDKGKGFGLFINILMTMKGATFSIQTWRGLAAEGLCPSFVQMNVIFVSSSLVVSVEGLTIGASD